jgi:hypothetical protein
MKIGAVMNASRRWEIEFQKYFWWDATGREPRQQSLSVLLMPIALVRCDLGRLFRPQRERLRNRLARNAPQVVLGGG